jgi:hypothetical protein
VIRNVGTVSDRGALVVDASGPDAPLAPALGGVLRTVKTRSPRMRARSSA